MRFLPSHPLRSLAPISLALLASVTLAAACGGDDSAADNGDGGADALATGDAPATVDGTLPGADSAVPPTPSPYGIDSRPPNPTCIAPARPPSNVAVKFTQIAATTTLTAPIMMRQAPGDPSTFYVALRQGTIVAINAANPPTGAAPVFLTVPGATGSVSTAGEGGLLGFAFHPSYKTNGQIFFSYTKQDPTVTGSGMRSTIARMDNKADGKTFTNYTEIVSFAQTTATNHKGGSIAFGPDGYLYFGFGDGGGGGDGFLHGQNTASYFAKIHRIDVDTPPPTGKTYVVPATNPFANGGGQDSTYLWGVRNPFRFTFDRGSGDMWIGEVGQDAWEEIDRVQAPGANLGWSCLEGTHNYASTDKTKCPNPKASFLAPVFEYDHNVGKAIIGGVVYRGKNIPSMVGTYVYADEVVSTIWALQYDQTGKASSLQLNSAGPNGNWAHIGEDTDGEAYFTDIVGGKIYRMDPAPAADAGAGPAFPDTLTKTGCVDPSNAQKAVAGAIPYGVNSPLWSDGADKGRWMGVPDGKTITVTAEGHLDLPIGSVLMKSFALGGKLVETRLLVHHADGEWAGYSYEWNDAQTDATLLAGSKSKAVGTQTWYYPSRSDCFSCHSGAASRTLGMLEGQLNGDFTYPSTNRLSNQLATLDHIGMFAAPLGKPPVQIVAYPTPTGTAGSLEERARSYLQSNCSHCHRPTGNGGGPMDFRFTTPLGDAHMCNVAPDNGDLGVAGALILKPGDASKSLLSLRPHALDSNRMPPLASHVVDTAGVGVVDQWIGTLTSCPGPSDAGAADAAHD